jgi:hypothetical protein
VASGVDPAAACVTGARASSPRPGARLVDLLPNNGVARLEVLRGGKLLVQELLRRSGEDVPEVASALAPMQAKFAQRSPTPSHAPSVALCCSAPSASPAHPSESPPCVFPISLPVCPTSILRRSGVECPPHGSIGPAASELNKYGSVPAFWTWPLHLCI